MGKAAQPEAGGDLRILANAGTYHPQGSQLEGCGFGDDAVWPWMSADKELRGLMFRHLSSLSTPYFDDTRQ